MRLFWADKELKKGDKDYKTEDTKGSKTVNMPVENAGGDKPEKGQIYKKTKVVKHNFDLLLSYVKQIAEFESKVCFALNHKKKFEECMFDMFDFCS